MFFWLKEEANIAGVMPDLADYTECLENLGEAGFRKHHLVLGDRSMLGKILDLDISRKARAYFGSVLTKYATIGDCRATFGEFSYRPDAMLQSKTQAGQCHSHRSLMLIHSLRQF